jgi:hypothetical protein
MAGKDLDALAKGLAEEQISRGAALKRVGAALVGGLLASIPVAAFAAPRTCATCSCGTGRPCNEKATFCVEVGRGFPSAQDQCSARCTQAGFKFCGAGTQFHCPQGCTT